MVVLSASIVTKQGKPLVSRQFVEMTRIRIEGLLAAFPKLLGGTTKEHTYVETDSVRYVYQPMENLYLLIITNRSSNIIEDLETLRLLSKVFPDVAGSTNNLSEEKVTNKSFELLFAFDEVITHGGYREPVSLQQVRTHLEMDSHEEKLHNMIKISKMESAKDQARDAARSIRERAISESSPAGGSGMGMGSGMGGGGAMRGGPMSNGMGGESLPLPSPKSVSHKPTTAARGMSLAPKGGKNKSLEDALYKEDKLAPALTSAAAAAQAQGSEPTPIQQNVHPITLAVAEKVSARLTRDGTLTAMDIKGSLTLHAADDAAGMCAVQLAVPESSQFFTFATHPKVNKAAWEQQGLLELKDKTKGFPSARPVGILRWTLAGAAEDLVPLKINCWPEEESYGKMNVSIEYSLEPGAGLELHQVQVRVPLGTTAAPEIISAEAGSQSFANGELLWELPLINTNNATGSLEFNLAQSDAESFFPITVTFLSRRLFCDIGVESVSSTQSGLAIAYGSSRMLCVDEQANYIIE